MVVDAKKERLLARFNIYANELVDFDMRLGVLRKRLGHAGKVAK